jgi:hypothetical protein
MQVGVALAAAVLLAASATARAQTYEVWAIDQGTATVHVYDERLEETAKLELSGHAWHTRAAYDRFHAGRRLCPHRGDRLG